MRKSSIFIVALVTAILVTNSGCAMWNSIKSSIGGSDNGVDTAAVADATGLSIEAQALVKAGIPDFLSGYMVAPSTTTSTDGEKKPAADELKKVEGDAITDLPADTRAAAEKSAAREAWVRRVKALRDSVIANSGTVAELLSKSGFRDLDEVMGYADFRPAYLGKKLGNQIIGEKQVRLIWNATERDAFRTNHPTTSDDEIRALDAPLSPPADEPKPDPALVPATDPASTTTGTEPPAPAEPKAPDAPPASDPKTAKGKKAGDDGSK